MNRHARSGSAGIDSRAFREAIARMRQEVLESRAETQRVKDQLNCLILLIKRSWNGDKAATVHVSNIVGMAPPMLLMEEPVNEQNEKYVPGKSRAYNHWAMLTLGLLNQHYKHLEVHALARAKARLESRQSYLEEQLAYHRDLVLQTKSMSFSVPVNSGNFFVTEQKEHKNGKLAVLSKDKRPVSGKSTFHVTSTETQKEASPNDMLDIILDTSSRTKTFCKPGLFDASQVVGDRPKPKRPVSGQQQRKADSTRARPSSAVVTKGERPLKSETTRPVSTGIFKGQRAKSAKVRGHESNNTKTLHSLINPTMSKVKFDKKNIHHKDSISDDLRKMEIMEEEFTKTTKLLQEKLGIQGGGII
ncbi:uncharacterized protein LOC117117401 [Anneissia japonica]|uniref:uncharacterized protein LOC117117401 n=1 Tax=Anneissia japonica TaxID=1529436 RepID=UPI0014259A14|nr:uncharacterized protein LOC117117401 [Anneissia japonica]